MSSDAVLWTYALAPDVTVDRSSTGAVLGTGTAVVAVERTELELLPCLAGPGGSERQLQDRLRGVRADEEDPAARCAALLYRLDRAGLLARGLWSGGRSIAWCVPLRPPPAGPPAGPPEGILRLSKHAIARRAGTVISIETPTAWARLELHDRLLLPLLQDLAAGAPAAPIAAAARGFHAHAIGNLLALMHWCELFDAGDGGWSPHDLLFHARTRRGYTRASPGKSSPGEGTAREARSAPSAPPRIALDLPDAGRLAAGDPPFAWVAERRRCIRRYGPAALTSARLSEFLFRTLHERAGRRPYPSGGSCYPLQAYLAIRECGGMAPGLYLYDPVRHELIPSAQPGAALEDLLAEAAAAAGSRDMPQILLVLAATYARTAEVYGDLSYSLILKEVGAVFQTAMMAAAAMGIGVCPLGSGNSLRFADALGGTPAGEVSVGELILGAPAEDPG